MNELLMFENLVIHESYQAKNIKPRTGVEFENLVIHESYQAMAGASYSIGPV